MDNDKEVREIPEFLRKQDAVTSAANRQSPAAKPVKPKGSKLMEWIRRKLDLASGTYTKGNLSIAIGGLVDHRRLIDGLRSDLAATQEALAERNRQMLDLQGEIMRIEHYMEVYRDHSDSTDPRRYELHPIPRRMRREQPRGNSRGRAR